jgi:hypothetical protein
LLANYERKIGFLQISMVLANMIKKQSSLIGFSTSKCMIMLFGSSRGISTSLYHDIREINLAGMSMIGYCSISNPQSWISGAGSRRMKIHLEQRAIRSFT